MNKRYLILMVGITIQAADQISTEGTVITPDLQGNAATATHAVYTVQASQALQAVQADYALKANEITEPLAGDVTGDQKNTVVATIGGQSAAAIAATVQTVQEASSDYTGNTLVCRDAKGDFSARNIKATLLGNATTAGHANTFNKPLDGDVTGKQFSTVVNRVGGQLATQIAAATQTVQTATAATIPMTLVMRDAQGNFAANIITAHVEGNAATATHAESARRADYAETANKAVCATQAEHTLLAERAIIADQATQALQSETALRSAQADCATCAHIFTEPLAGDVTGNQNSTVVTTVGGQSAEQIATATQTVQAATADAAPTTLIMRDTQGDFAAHVIRADLQGNAATATQALRALETDHALSADKALSADRATQAMHADTSVHSAQAECAGCANTFTEPLAGDVTGNQHSTRVTTVGGQSADAIAIATHAVQAATADAQSTTLIMRDAQGDFAAHIISADLQGNAQTATYALKAGQADRAVSAEHAECAVCATTATQSEKALIADQAKQAENALYAETANKAARATQADHALVADEAARAERATHALQSDASLRSAQSECAACAAIFTEPLTGDVTGVHNATVVNAVGGYSAEQIAAAVQKIATTSFEASPITITTDGGNAISKAGRLTIRGGQNLKVRGSDTSVVISLTASPSVTGSLSAGTTITAGTGLQVVSGGAAIMGDTKINIAGSGSTTIGNPTSMTIYNGPLCFKQVNQGVGTPLGIDDEGNVVLLAADTRTYQISDKKLYALLQAFVTTLSEQGKRIEHIESLVCKQE